MSTTAHLMPAAQLQWLLDLLIFRGYEVIGPVVEEGVIVYDALKSVEQLPQGLRDVQAPGRYRLEARDDGAWFGHAVGPHAWKRWLHPPKRTLWTATRHPETGQLEIADEAPTPHKLAFIGIRPCDLKAVGILDRVLLHSGYRDLGYARQRDAVLFVAVQCTSPADTCFCTSMGTGPRADDGFDLALTELPQGSPTLTEHHFVVQARSKAGHELVTELGLDSAAAAHQEAALAATDAAAQSITRRMPTEGLKTFLQASYNHERWDDIATRCLSCANCTMACPTCFCTRNDTVTDLHGTEARLERSWDSCFTSSFSYMHGGPARPSAYSRYRQWMTHKLASWHDQFDSSGCVGCGRCLTWCPVGIDITAEVAAMRATPHAIHPAPEPAGGVATQG